MEGGGKDEVGLLTFGVDGDEVAGHLCGAALCGAAVVFQNAEGGRYLEPGLGPADVDCCHGPVDC